MYLVLTKPVTKYYFKCALLSTENNTGNIGTVYSTRKNSSMFREIKVSRHTCKRKEHLRVHLILKKYCLIVTFGSCMNAPPFTQPGGIIPVVMYFKHSMIV